MTKQVHTDIEYLRQATVGEPTVLTEKIEVRDYDPQWPHMYEQLAADIRATLGQVAVSITHVGSTSVPNLAAKPIIDIDLIVSDPACEESYVPALESRGYRLRIREPQWHQHRLLKLDDPKVHLHVFGLNAEPALQHLRFRDWLRTHSQDRELYASTKRELAERQWTYMQEYADAKTPVITRILEKAGHRFPQALSRMEFPTTRGDPSCPCRADLSLPDGMARFSVSTRRRFAKSRKRSRRPHLDHRGFRCTQQLRAAPHR